MTGSGNAPGWHEAYPSCSSVRAAALGKSPFGMIGHPVAWAEMLAAFGFNWNCWLEPKPLAGKILVPPDEESLNDIFQTLADWEYQLKACREVIPREIFDDQEGPAP